MPVWGWILVAIAAVIVIGAVVWAAASRQRTRRLQTQFGPEYQRSVEQTGDRRQAEADLRERTRRREGYDIRPLSAPARERYANDWRVVQGRFVDAPADAVREADGLVVVVMGEMGYPMADFEQRQADVSVDHPVVVQNYRAAHEISERNQRGDASTEDLRQAMVHYRALFEDLLHTPGDETSGTEQIAEAG